MRLIGTLPNSRDHFRVLEVLDYYRAPGSPEMRWAWLRCQDGPNLHEYTISLPLGWVKVEDA